MLLRIIAVCVCMVILLGCAKGVSVVAGRINVGDMAPMFVLKDIFGKEEISSAKVIYNSDATVIAIWSMACPTCREALLDVQKVYDQYASKRVAFLGINFDVENIHGVRAFLEAEQIEFTTLWDRRSRVTRAYKALDYTFSVFVVNGRGRVVFSQYDHPPDLALVLAESLDQILAGKGD